jgi:hypothetical protein
VDLVARSRRAELLECDAGDDVLGGVHPAEALPTVGVDPALDLLTGLGQLPFQGFDDVVDVAVVLSDVADVRGPALPLDAPAVGGLPAPLRVEVGALEHDVLRRRRRHRRGERRRRVPVREIQKLRHPWPPLRAGNTKGRPSDGRLPYQVESF